MTPEDFRRHWRGDLCEFSGSYLTPLPAEASSFLSEVGLPTSAAPFMSFGRADATRIPTVAELLRLGDANECDADMNALWWIGSTGAGDLVAVDIRGAVWGLNHDDGFAPYAIASSVSHLAAILVAYAAYEERLERDRDTERHEAANRWLEGEIRRIDPKLDVEAFWADELENSPEDDAHYGRVVSEIRNAADDIDAVIEKLDTLPPDVI